ncbi:unnamed protein product [Rhodiola kirilowii]
MAVYYKFKSAKDFDTIPIDGHFVSVAILKEKIFESKHLGRGTDFDLVVTNVQTGEEYLDEETLIPKGTSVLIRRVPGRPRMPIVTQQQPKVENKVEDPEPPNSSFTGADSSSMKYPDDTDWDEFGSDLYAIPDMTPVQFTNPIQDAPPPTTEDEDSKIQALIETPALDWQQQSGDGYGPGRGFGRGGRMMGGRGFGRLGLGSDKRTPPPGYVCHRCKVPGHFIQHCPTNGDPSYDVKKVKPPTGIPKSMLIETPDGSYALPSGSVAVLKPNEAAFEKEIDGLPTTRAVGEIPLEHRCPLCKEIMKDAVITVKCCFATFCDRCIRDHIISNSACVCGKKDVLADDLIPNMLSRSAINRFLENNNNSSAENPGSNYQVQDVESSRFQPARVPSPTLSAASKGEQPPIVEEKITPKPAVDEEQATAAAPAAPQQTPEDAKPSKVANSEATHESVSAKEPASQMSAPQAEDEVQQKASAETGKKVKKKKARAPANAAEMQWKNSQDFGAENYMMPMGPAGFNPYWNGMQPGMEAFMPPFGAPLPFMGGYPLGPIDMAYGGGFMPQDPYAAQGAMYPPARPHHPYQRDRADFGMGFNGGPPPAMSREEFEARKADLRRKREMEERRAGSMRNGDLPPRNREPSRDITGGSTAAKPKSRLVEEDNRDYRNHRHDTSSSRHRSPPRRSARISPPPPSLHRDVEMNNRPTKRKSSERERDYEDDRRRRDRHRSHRSESADRQLHGADHTSAKVPVPARSESSTKASRTESKSTSAAAAAAATADGKSKASVFARISFPEEAGASKKKKMSSSGTEAAALVQGGGKDASMTSGGGTKRKSGSLSGDYYGESSDEDRHFKRKPSRYEASPVDPDSRYSGSSRSRR